MKTKITSILFLLLLSMFGGRLFAQVLLNAPPAYQPATLVQGAAPGTFKVDIVNNNASVLSGATLTLALPAGVEYVAGSVTAATQTNITDLRNPIFTLSSIPVGNTLTVTFDARINCGFTIGTTIGYTVKNGSTTLVTSSSAVSANTPLPAYVLLGAPQPTASTTTLNTNALRTVKFKNSGNVAVNTVYIESTVATASHAPSYKVMSADHGTVSSVTNGYRVTLTGAALQSAISTTVGAADTSFDPGEEITVVLTEQIVSCAVTTNIPLNFKAGSGDTKGSFCFSDGSPASILATVGNPSISLARVPSTTTYPTFCTTGKTSYVITNGGTGGAESALHDIKLPWSVARNNSFFLAVAPVDGITIKKVSIGGVDITAQVLMKNGTGSGALVPAAQNVDIINLAGLTSAPGTSPLVDLDGDGHFDDLMPGKTVRLDFEYGFNPDTFQSCLLQSSTSTTDGNGYFNLGTSYKNQCGAIINKADYTYTVSGLTDASQPGYLIANQNTNTNSATIDRALFNVGDKATVTLTMLMNQAGALYGSTLSITKVFTIVLPDGLDYDPTGR
ncbi:hypothetical protein [Flavobacterium sp. UBA4854]|uniref:hypothetical protein n=1 Tax=Flavobacterium sp. UBA4854 TaxID=1946548 RepID=UPI0025804293|nr:hypothetical protein [Flavobacterium sp. UBA4854]